MTTPNASIRIAPAAQSRAYDRMIFGGFLEHFDNQIYGGVFDPGSPLSDEQGFRLDVIEALKELKVPVIRWPGGCFVDGYDWRKGVGPTREPCGDPRWGVIEPNTFGTHEFVELCRRIGAEPYICHNGVCDPQENIDWVNYCNATEGPMAELRREHGHPEPLNVRIWSVGNERSDRAYIDRVRETAAGMKADDPKVQITCSGPHADAGRQMPPVDSYLLDTAAAFLDYVSVHSYWLSRGPQGPSYDYLTAISRSEIPDASIRIVADALAQAGHGDIKIAFDEWNLRAWQHPGFPRDAVEDYADPEVLALVEQRRRENDEASQYTMADALFSASFLNACLRNCEHVTMANVAPLVNTRGPLFVHPHGIVKRTSFHAMAMYANTLQERVIETEVKAETLTHSGQSFAMLDAITTVDRAGESWSIAIANRHPSEAAACTIRLGDHPVNGTFKASVLSAESPDAFNDLESPDRVAPKAVQLSLVDGRVLLPPHSLTILHVNG